MHFCTGDDQSFVQSNVIKKVNKKYTKITDTNPTIQ